MKLEEYRNEIKKKFNTAIWNDRNRLQHFGSKQKFLRGYRQGLDLRTVLEKIE